MNKADIIEFVASREEMKKTDVASCLDSFLAAITTSLSRHEDVGLKEFGTFKIKNRVARKARNPKTGDIVEVPAKSVVVFKVAPNLKEAVK